VLDFARLPLDEQIPYFQEVANRRGLSRLIVEKDFWVCFSLCLLFSTRALEEKLVFKGGTSLSKVFGIIQRFSEDIDLSVDPGWLGFGGENRPDAARARSQFEKRWKKLNDACAAAVDQKVRTALELAIQAVLGPTRDGSPYLIFKLELGSLTDQRPIGNHTITPWVAEEFPALFTAPTCRVVALEIERTFWEKVTILHTEYYRPVEKPMRSRFSRDCYDVCRMAAHPAGERAMKDLDLLARVVRHKRTYFYSAWANYATAKPGSLRLVPPAHRLADLKADYQQMQEMFTEPPPPFGDAMKSDRIKNWPKAERPREKLLAEGAEKQTDANLLAAILRVGRGTFKKGEAGQNAQALARVLLKDFCGLKGLDRATIQELLQAPGLSAASVESSRLSPAISVCASSESAGRSLLRFS